VKVLVTGGAGFIGSWVVRAYLEAGHEVVAVDDLSTGRRERVPPGVRLYEVDIRTPALGEVMERERPQVVNHHAAQSSVAVSMASPGRDAEVNILGTLNLLGACLRTGVRQVVYASTGGALYGECPRPATEEDPVRPISPYGVSKYAGELYLRAFGETYGLPYTILRYANVYGPGQDPHGEAGVVAIFTWRMLRGEPVVIYGDGTQERDFVFVEDIGRANLLALGRAGLTVNLGTGVPVSIRGLFERLARLTGYDRPPTFAPPRPGDLHRSVLDASRARIALGWEAQTPLEEGLRRTVEAFRGEG